MLINRKLVLAAAIALTLGTSSCKKFMDVNTNPNVSQTATVQTLLPAAQLYIGSAVGVDLEVIGSIWAQYWTQTPVGKQYVAFEQYAPVQDQFATGWTNLYAGAENFYQLYNLADTQHKKQYKAVALLMQAYTFQVITDGWGDVPQKQALQGEYTKQHKINPQYDAQLAVYNTIISYLDSANKLMNSSSGNGPGADDLVYRGDMSKWRKFSNTLRLKVLLREAYIDPTGARRKIDTLFNSSPAFIGTGDDAFIAYGYNANNKNPLYSEESAAKMMGIQQLGGSKTCIDSMVSNNDPREGLFYGSGAGITQGSYNIALPAGSYAIPSYTVAGDASNATSGSAPVNLLTSYESYFLQAEVAARGWGPATGDDSLFYWGIKANFTYYGYAGGYNTYITNGGYWTMYPAGGTVAQKLRYIITQKWFAMCGNQGFEAWTEWRRTGYPDFLVHPISSMIGNAMPKRFLYPTSESRSNAGFPASGVAPVTSKVWWDLL